MAESDDAADAQHAEQSFVYNEFIQPRLERAERAYNQALTSLWLGNGGSAVATLSFIGAAWKGGNFPHQLLVPLWFFVLGLVSMGLGAGLAIWGDARSIRSMMKAGSFLDLHIDDLQSPAERVGLTLADWRTRMALVSAALFVIGCLAGLFELTFAR